MPENDQTLSLWAAHILSFVCKLSHQTESQNLRSDGHTSFHAMHVCTYAKHVTVGFAGEVIAH